VVGAGKKAGSSILPVIVFTWSSKFVSRPLSFSSKSCSPALEGDLPSMYWDGLYFSSLVSETSEVAKESVCSIDSGPNLLE